ncbi:MAG: hypothetical protein KatS3mg017_0853 [Fimbriimonadales bacterium]|nr:MAG: hypothetical protein KatS3mg017_0853 [Fimbriimonadales bacterium]
MSLTLTFLGARRCGDGQQVPAERCGRPLSHRLWVVSRRKRMEGTQLGAAADRPQPYSRSAADPCAYRPFRLSAPASWRRGSEAQSTPRKPHVRFWKLCCWTLPSYRSRTPNTPIARATVAISLPYRSTRPKMRKPVWSTCAPMPFHTMLTLDALRVFYYPDGAYSRFRRD